MMNITLIGAGNLATNLALALCQAGHCVRQIFSRTMESARALSTRLGNVQFTNRLEQIDDLSDIYIIAVKDDALSNVAKQLAELLPQAFLVHTAGTLPLDTLCSQRRGVFYPMQTFSKERTVDFSEIPCFIEAASTGDLQVLQSLATSISHCVFNMSSNDRQYLHLAAVFCCNFANHCSTLAAQLLQRHDIPFSVMLPLIDETTRKLHQLSPIQAQTGPAARNDQQVMQRQLLTLQQEENPMMAEIYHLMSNSIIETHTKPTEQ